MSYPYYGSVPPKNKKSSGSELGSTSYLSPTMIGLICVGVVAGGIWVNRTAQVFSTSSLSLKSTTSPAVKTSSIIDFGLVRAMYDPLPYFKNTYDSYLNYAFLKGIDAIVEPYQTMNLYFYDTDISNGNYLFDVCPEQSKENCQQGYSYAATEQKGTTKKGVKFECTPYTRYDITLSTLDDAGNVVSTQAGKALCLFVRREIRKLLPSDLSAYMDANYVLYSTSDEDGKKVYGPAFRNNTLLMRYHHFNSALLDSDHIHEGNGFLTQHLKLTNMFDEAVRVVDPTQSIPYWDFTIDSAEGRKPYESFILTAETYGSMTLPKNMTRGYEYSADKINDGRIANGRWKDLKADMNYYYPEDNYGYGFLRGPWNMNPSPYVTRFAFEFNDKLALPNCESHYDAVQFDDMMDFFFWSSFSPHSKTHTTFAGFYGCDKFKSLVDAGYIKSDYDARIICSSWSFYTKEFWRKGYIKPNTECKVSDNLESSFCGFQCVEENKDAMTTFLFPQIASRINKSVYDDAVTAFQDFICTGDMGYIFTGDHLESASPGDPSFWVIHPTMERLLQAKLMAGGFETEIWATDQENEFVCSKGTCYNETLNTIDYFDNCCYGHREEDRMLDAESGDRTKYVGPTNGEVMAMADPRSTSYGMPYIYDEFNWNHCLTNDGYDFLSLLDSMKDEADIRLGLKNGKKDEKRAHSAQQLETKQRKAMFNNWSKEAKKWEEVKKAKKAAAAAESKKAETK